MRNNLILQIGKYLYSANSGINDSKLRQKWFKQE